MNGETEGLREAEKLADEFISGHEADLSGHRSAFVIIVSAALERRDEKLEESRIAKNFLRAEVARLEAEVERLKAGLERTSNVRNAHFLKTKELESELAEVRDKYQNLQNVFANYVGESKARIAVLEGALKDLKDASGSVVRLFKTALPKDINIITLSLVIGKLEEALKPSEGKL